MSVTAILLPAGYEAGSYAPALDVTGTALANKVIGEVQTFGANSSGVLQLLVPSYAPFFADDTSLHLVYINAQNVETPLVYGVDYYYAFPYIGASRALNKAVYGGIIFLNEALAGKLRMTYQTLGGDWLLDASATQDTGNHAGIDYYTTTWEQVAAYGVEFPIINQAWDRPDGVSVADLIDGLATFNNVYYNALLAANEGSNNAMVHVLDLNNPHQDTADTIGLDLVSNFAPSTNLQAADISNTTSFIAPSQMTLAINTAVPPASEATYGLVIMNVGLYETDGLDAGKALTSAGFVRMVSDRTTPIAEVFNKSQIEIPIPGWPLTFPVIWDGGQYANIADLVAAWQVASGVSPIEYCTQPGKIWLPSGSQIIDITTTR